MDRRLFGSAMIGLGVGVVYSGDRHGSAWSEVSQQEQAGRVDTAKHGDVFKPGDTAPANGIYDAVHGKLDGEDHYPPHQVTAMHGETFPPCRLCQDLVRFRLRQVPEHIKAHHLFKT